MKRLVKSIVLLLVAGLMIHAQAFAHARVHHLPKDKRVAGGIAVLRLKKPSFKRPLVLFKGKRVMVRAVKGPGQWAAVVGIPLNTQPGRYRILVSQPRRQYQQSFIVAGKRVIKQHLRIRNKHKVDPDNKDMRRIIRERARIHKIYNSARLRHEADLNLAWPVHGPISATFGLKRILNGKPKNTHSGLDIAVPKGRTIRAASAGRIIGVENLFYTGNTVFVDHGQGFMTIYCHMSKTLVHTGQMIKKKQPLGLVGMTGRVTGPHLHFITVLNQTKVNPKLLLPRAPVLGSKRKVKRQ